MKQVEVVAGVIQNSLGQYLCVQRGPNKYAYIDHKYEFPGGKIEFGEDRRTALIRELGEELEIEELIIESELITVEHAYPDFYLTMHAFLCIVPTNKHVLKEHINSKWLNIEEMEHLDWAAADVPILFYLQQNAAR